MERVGWGARGWRVSGGAGAGGWRRGRGGGAAGGAGGGTGGAGGTRGTGGTGGTVVSDRPLGVCDLAREADLSEQLQAGHPSCPVLQQGAETDLR